MEDFELYNRHYLKTREDGAIVDAFSDGPHHSHTTEGYTLFNPKGGYQLRLILDGEMTEENPPLFTFQGVPLYKYVDGQIQRRTEAEIQAEIDAIPAPPPSEQEVLRADVDFLLAMTL